MLFPLLGDDILHQMTHFFTELYTRRKGFDVQWIFFVADTIWIGGISRVLYVLKNLSFCTEDNSLFKCLFVEPLMPLSDQFRIFNSIGNFDLVLSWNQT